MTRPSLPILARALVALAGVVPLAPLIATGRHITGGGPDLVDVSWSTFDARRSPGSTQGTVEGPDGVLAGRSRVVGGDPYELFLTGPPGRRLAGLDCAGGRALATERGEAMVRTGCAWDEIGEVAWRARFARQP